jgi:transposase
VGSDLVNVVVPQHGEVVSELIDIRGHSPARSPSHTWRHPGGDSRAASDRREEAGWPSGSACGELSNQEGSRLLRIVRRSTGSVATWRRAQMVLLSAQGMDIAQIAQVTFTSPDRVRDVLHNSTWMGSTRCTPRYRGGRPPSFTLAQRRAIKQLALSRPQDHDLPFSTWSLVKLADFLVVEGGSSRLGARQPQQEDVSAQSRPARS